MNVISSAWRCFLGSSVLLFALSPVVRAEEVEGKTVADASAPAASKTEPKQITYYTFFDLLNRSERIVYAEVTKDKDGNSALKVQQSLKALPWVAPKKVDPEAVKRAAARLANDKVDLPPPPAPAAAPQEVLKVQTEKSVPIPPEGTLAIFFLWEHTAPGEATYRISHPQSVYDADLLPQVKLGANRPRSVADGRYLREWDHQMATRARQREADKALETQKGGETVTGLRLWALRPQVSVRHDNSFSITAKIENTHAKDQAIYDGPAGAYAVRLRPKAGGATTVLHMNVVNANVDSTVLSITDALDFTTVPRESSITKELFFDAKEIKGLGALNGEYAVSTIYSSAFDGSGLDIGTPVWTGTMVSEEVPITFEGNSGK